MKKLSADVCAVTHAGRVRRDNEDNYSLNGKLTSTGDLKKGSAYVQHMAEPFHLCVCDGMGGESYGDAASSIAVESVATSAAGVYESGDDFSFAISNTLNDANNKICGEITARGTRMGTTLAAVYAVKGKVICVSMGDTRIYHYSNGILEQMSFDHTHAQGFVDAMAVSRDDINSIPDAKRLTKHLGVFPEEASLSPNISVIDDVDNGDIILLCSDGLTDMLSDDEITEILAGGENSRDVTGKLIKKALEKGGKDNITVVSAFIETEDISVFKPIAEEIAGGADPDYSEEYKNSFSNGVEPADGEETSPYANADAWAYEKPVDKMKIVKIVVIALVALAVLTVAALIVKSVFGGKAEEETTTESATEFYYVPSTTEQEISTWNFDETTTESTTEETTEETTDDVTIVNYSTTSKRYTTTTKRYYNTTTKRYTTTTKNSTTTTKKTKTGEPVISSTTKKDTSSTTAKADESTTNTSSETSSVTESTSATSAAETSATSSTTESTGTTVATESTTATTTESTATTAATTTAASTSDSASTQ